MTKVVCIDGKDCEFCSQCENCFQDDPSVTVGAVYTVVEAFSPCHGVMLIRLAEAPLPPGAWWCHCCFREVEGDADEWKRIMEAHRPKTKTKELEPV